MTFEPIRQPLPAPDRLLSFRDAISVVGCSRAKVYLLLAEGRFPQPVKIGRNNYFSEGELQEWVGAQLAGRRARGEK